MIVPNNYIYFFDIGNFISRENIVIQRSMFSTYILKYLVNLLISSGVCSLFGLVMVLATAYDVIVVRWLKPRETIEPQTSIVEVHVFTILNVWR